MKKLITKTEKLEPSAGKSDFQQLAEYIIDGSKPKGIKKMDTVFDDTYTGLIVLGLLLNFTPII
jgi:hypothetical protein